MFLCFISEHIHNFQADSHPAIPHIHLTLFESLKSNDKNENNGNDWLKLADCLAEWMTDWLNTSIYGLFLKCFIAKWMFFLWQVVGWLAGSFVRLFIRSTGWFICIIYSIDGSLVFIRLHVLWFKQSEPRQLMFRKLLTDIELIL